MSIKKLILYIYDKAFFVKDAIYDFFTRNEVAVSLGDLMSFRGIEDGLQLLVASRLMDVEAYVLNNDDSFQYQKLMTTCGKSGDFYYDDNKDKKLFVDLINSYLKKGYNGKSHFHLDKDCLLRNGTHRAAMHIYLKDYSARAYVLKRKFLDHDVFYTLLTNSLPRNVFEQIELKLKKIREDLVKNGVTFCAIIQNKITLADIFCGEQIHEEKSYLLKDVFISKCPELRKGFKLKKDCLYKMVLFTLEQPEYKIISGRLESSKIKNMRNPTDCFISPSCYVGKQVYDMIKQYFEEEHVISE